MRINELVRKASDILETPFLIMDLEIVKENFIRMKEAFKGKAKVFYAVKANSHPRILTLLDSLGSHFDVASRGEIEKLLMLGVSPKKMSFGNTIKKEHDIRFAYNVGIDLYVADSKMEVEKIAYNAPGSKVFIRIATDGSDSDWPLSRKFGVEMERALDLILYAKKLRLKPIGMSFHVGSQNYNKYSWRKAIEKVSKVFAKAMRNGVDMFFLNVGGGFPIRHLKPIPSIEEIAKVIFETVEEFLWFVPTIEIAVEPGRYMVGDAGIMVTRVVLRSEKEGEEWIYIDSGVFHGLAETLEGFRYELVVKDKEDVKKKKFVLAGPTCDSIDVIYYDALLPENTTKDDIVFFINAGAYTVEYSSRFNGFEPPSVVFLDEIEKRLRERISFSSL